MRRKNLGPSPGQPATIRLESSEASFALQLLGTSLRDASPSGWSTARWCPLASRASGSGRHLTSCRLVNGHSLSLSHWLEELIVPLYLPRVQVNWICHVSARAETQTEETKSGGTNFPLSIFEHDFTAGPCYHRLWPITATLTLFPVQCSSVTTVTVRYSVADYTLTLPYNNSLPAPAYLSPEPI
jgi:hypothetical protein